MKILLLNDNPVVNKLVTLSAQKTSDEVDTVSTLEGVESKNYDLLIVDDGIYSDELLSQLQEKIKYKKSLFICAKDAQEVESFSSVLKKPFLPTDLVELFIEFEKEVKNDVSESDDELSLDESLGESVLDEEEAKKVKDLLAENEEELSFDEEVENEIDNLELDEEAGIVELPEESEEEITFEDDDLLADYDLALDEEDEADADIAEEDSFNLEDDIATLEDEEPEDEIDENDLAMDLALDEENEADVDIPSDGFDDLNIEEDIENESGEEETLEEIPEDILDEVEEIEEIEEEVPEEIEIPEDILDEAEEIEEEIPEESQNLESEIQDAVKNLSQEDLESELDEDTLLQIATNEIDPLADLTSKDIKVALGEEVEDEVTDVDTPAVAEIEDSIINEEEDEGQNSGVKALKKLLEALNDKEVEASMKGMKISINITLGDN